MIDYFILNFVKNLLTQASIIGIIAVPVGIVSMVILLFHRRKEVPSSQNILIG